MFDALVAHVAEQCTDECEILYDDSVTVPVGHKRQSLLSQANGDYVVFIDDDDMVAHDYVDSILTAIDQSPDCIGLRGYMTTNGSNKQDWIISMREHEWRQSGNTFYRHTNHISPVKRTIALSVGFKDMTHGEDYKYSMGLKGLLTSEVFIDKELYFYRFVTNKKV